MSTQSNEPAPLNLGPEAADGSVMVELPGEEVGETRQGAADDDAGLHEESRTHQRASDQLDPELDGDQRLADPNREAIRQRRRQERADKKQKQREREDDLRQQLALSQRQLQEVSERLLQVEQRGTAADFAALEQAQARAGQAAKYYEGVIAQATKDQNGELVAQATQKMIAAANEFDRLRTVRESYTRASQSGQQPLDPAAKSGAEAWMRAHSWYDPNHGDNDSTVVFALDQRLMREGYDPRTKTYWDELTRRVEQYLPHRRSTSGDGAPYNGAAPQERPAGTPVAGSGREGGAATGARTSGTFQLSAARVQALKDAGVWDDPKARNEMIRAYREYDRRQAAARGG